MRETDPTSELSRSLRICDEFGLLRCLQLIEEEWNRRDQQTVDNGLSTGTLVAWRRQRGFQPVAKHLVVSCKEPPVVHRYGGQGRGVVTLCKKLLDYAEVWSEGPGRAGRDIDCDPKYNRKHDVVVTCKRCAELRAKETT